MIKPHEVAYIIRNDKEGVEKGAGAAAVLWTDKPYCDLSISMLSQSVEFVCDPQRISTEYEMRSCEWTYDKAV